MKLQDNRYCWKAAQHFLEPCRHMPGGSNSTLYSEDAAGFSHNGTDTINCTAPNAGAALRDLVEFTGYRHLVPGEGLRGGQNVGQRQRYPVQERFPRGPFDGRFGLRRTVHPDHDSSM